MNILAAAWCGDIDRVRQLLDNGADVNIITKYGYTALHYAVRWGHMNTTGIVFNGYMNRKYALKD